MKGIALAAVKEPWEGRNLGISRFLIILLHYLAFINMLPLPSVWCVPSCLSTHSPGDKPPPLYLELRREVFQMGRVMMWSLNCFFRLSVNPLIFNLTFRATWWFWLLCLLGIPAQIKLAYINHLPHVHRLLCSWYFKAFVVHLYLFFRIAIVLIYHLFFNKIQRSHKDVSLCLIILTFEHIELEQRCRH